jgi:hypothetical protein
LRSSSEAVGFFPSGQSTNSTPQLSQFAIDSPLAQTYIYGSNDLAAGAVTQVFLLTGSGVSPNMKSMPLQHMLDM